MVKELTIVNQPKHITLSVIVFNVDIVQTPLEASLHDNIFRLTDETDVIFLFYGDYRKVIDLDKFSSLYGACGWIYGEDITYTLFQVFQYGKEILERYVSYLVGNIEDLSEPGLDNILEKVQKVNMADIKWPVFKVRRLDPKELYNIYNKPLDSSSDKSMDSVKEWYNKFWETEDKTKPSDNRYSTWHSSSRLMYFKSDVINKLVDLWYEDEGEREWIETFTWQDPKYLLASMVKHLEMDIQDTDIENLNYDSKTERKKSKVS